LSEDQAGGPQLQAEVAGWQAVRRVLPPQLVLHLLLVLLPQLALPRVQLELPQQPQVPPRMLAMPQH
jgi:hypothetical protein